MEVFKHDGKEFTHVRLRSNRSSLDTALLSPDKEYEVERIQNHALGARHVVIKGKYENGKVPVYGIDIYQFLLFDRRSLLRIEADKHIDNIRKSVEHITGSKEELARKALTEINTVNEVLVEVAKPETKDTNPKDAAAVNRMPLALIPDAALAHVAMAFHEGATKYDPYNWRIAGVRASTYISGARRHISKWWNGDNTDPVSKVNHLANAVAGLMIVLDAEVQGLLNDDRPPKQDLEKLYNQLSEVQAHITKTFKKG